MDEANKKEEVEHIVDKTRVQITDVQLTLIENNFYKLRNRNKKEKRIFTLLRKLHQKLVFFIRFNFFYI